MDIEQLSKSQLVLLALLVSFVTSIATGIVTVTLVEQAPPAVAQTVNRVVERTVEKIAPSTQTAATVVTQQKTVVVKESELVAQAVSDATPSVVRVYSTSDANHSFISLGIVISGAGTIATDESAISDQSDAIIGLPDGTPVRAFVTARDEVNGLAFLTPASTTPSTVKWVPATLSAKGPELGASVIVLSGESVAHIGNGLVSSLTPVKSGTIIDTSVPETAIMKGSPLIDIDGNIIGVSTGYSRASSQTAFVPASAIKVPVSAKTTAGSQ